MRRWFVVFMIVMIATVLAACGGGEDNENEQNTHDGHETSNEGMNNEESSNSGDEAVETNATAEKEVLVSLKNPDGDIVGTATLTERNNGVNIHLEGENLPPGTHGFHIHEVGKCEAPTFESAGEHYNPTNAKHGFDHPEGPHAGDMKNIEVAEDGTVSVDVIADMVTLDPNGENTLYTEEGTSLMIHSDPDDYISQPSGNAGDRIACGVIGE